MTLVSNNVDAVSNERDDDRTMDSDAPLSKANDGPPEKHIGAALAFDDNHADSEKSKTS